MAPEFQATATNKRSQEVPATLQSISLLGFLDASSGKQASVFDMLPFQMNCEHAIPRTYNVW